MDIADKIEAQLKAAATDENNPLQLCAFYGWVYWSFWNKWKRAGLCLKD